MGWAMHQVSSASLEMSFIRGYHNQHYENHHVEDSQKENPPLNEPVPSKSKDPSVRSAKTRLPVSWWSGEEGGGATPDRECGVERCIRIWESILSNPSAMSRWNEEQGGQKMLFGHQFKSHLYNMIPFFGFVHTTIAN